MKAKEVLDIFNLAETEVSGSIGAEISRRVNIKLKAADFRVESLGWGLRASYPLFVKGIGNLSNLEKLTTVAKYLKKISKQFPNSQYKFYRPVSCELNIFAEDEFLNQLPPKLATHLKVKELVYIQSLPQIVDVFNTTDTIIIIINIDYLDQSIRVILDEEIRNMIIDYISQVVEKLCRTIRLVSFP